MFLCLLWFKDFSDFLSKNLVSFGEWPWLGWLCWPGRGRVGWVCVLMGKCFRSTTPLPSLPHLSPGLHLSQSQPGILRAMTNPIWGPDRLLSTEIGTLSLATKFPCPATSWLEPQAPQLCTSPLHFHVHTPAAKPQAYPSIHYLPPLTLWCSVHVGCSSGQKALPCPLWI